MRRFVPFMYKPVLLTVLCFVLAILCGSTSVQAADFTVTNGNNAGAGSLRQAIIDANASAGPHRIFFSGVTTVTVTASLPAITQPVAIDGGGSVTITGPNAETNLLFIVFGAGASNSSVKGLILQNTGADPVKITGAISGVVLENLYIRCTGARYMDNGVNVTAAVTNLTIRNVEVRGIQNGGYGLKFGQAVNGLLLDKFRLTAGTGGAGRGISFAAAATNITIRNSTVDLDAPATADDGDYGLYFAAAATNVQIDSSTFRGSDGYSVFCATTATDFKLKNTAFDNLEGSGTAVFIRFVGNTTRVAIDNCLMDGRQRTGTDNADNAILMHGVNNQMDTLTNSVFRNHEVNAVYIGSANDGPNNHDYMLIKGNSFTKNGNGNSGTIDFIARNVTSDGGPVLITENTFDNNNGCAIMVRPGNGTAYALPNFTVSKNIIKNTRSTYGGVRTQYITKVIITQNSIYNNEGLGIEHAYAGNCGYEGANTPQMVASTETSPGVYDVTVKMPTICGTNACSLELFASDASTIGAGGQYYVKTVTGLGSGNRVLSGVSATAITSMNQFPYGFWTATLKLNNNCGTSEFSNRIKIRPGGPAGVNNGVQLWLSPDDVAGGNMVAGKGWQDVSGNNRHFSALTSDPAGVAANLNYNNYVNFDGDDYLLSPVTGFLKNFTAGEAITVLRSVSNNATRGFPYDFGGTQRGIHYSWSNGGIYTSFGTNDRFGWNPLNSTVLDTKPNTTVTGQPVDVLKWNLFGTYGASGSWAADYNGGQQTALSTSNTIDFGLPGNRESIGYDAGSKYVFAGDIAEVILYNRKLTENERQKINTYLGIKNGLTLYHDYLASNGNVIWSLSGNSGYNKAIAGLLRDELSVIHQRQSKSTSFSDSITIALGNTIAARNVYNEYNITNDLSAFVWGGNGLAKTYTVTISTGTKVSLRMASVWKVQKSNWADQDITIKIDGARAGIFLLVSNTADFSTLTSELPVNSNGTITLSSALLANGAYFTFGRQQNKPGGVLPGLSSWIKADAGIALTGTDATTLEDQSPSQRIWPKVNTNAINWNSSLINYNPALQFTGNSYYTINPAFTNSFTQGEIFSVQSSNANSAANFPWQLGGSSGNTGVFYRYTDNNMYLHWGMNARQAISYGTKNSSAPIVLNVNSASNLWTASLDGKVVSGPSAFATSFAQAATNNAIGVGTASWFIGPISEVILYNRKLTTTERTQVNSYMALKYGISLDPTATPDYIGSDGATIMWKGTSNTGYTNNIAGIARDDDGTLYQKQSRSINSTANGNIISIGIGESLPAGNLDNQEEIANDRSFFVWGDNNGAVTYTTAVAAIPGIKSTIRMPRVWKVQKTNWADDNITLKLHSAAVNLSLLISNTDPTFANIDQEIPFSTDGTVTVGTDMIPNGAYFTIAKQVKGPGFVNTGVQLWLRADDAISSGENWIDYSGNDNNAAQASAGFRPVLTSAVNYNPGFRFNGSNQYMDFTGNLTITGTNPYTIVALGMRESIGAWHAFLSHQTTNTGGFLFGISGANNLQTHRTGTGPLLTSTTVYSQTNLPYLVSGTRAGNVFSLYNNGKVDISATVTTNNSFNANGMRLGNRDVSADLAFLGKIPEVIVYNRALSALELQKVHSYLGFKYGLTLDRTAVPDYVASNWNGTTGTKMWTASKNTGYDKNIAGIGRDELSNLYQKQSRSSVDTLLSVALGSGFAAENAGNNGTIEDLSFFAWADNGLAATYTIPITGFQATARMPKVWKVDRTNWDDQDITIKVSKNGDRYLLVNTQNNPAFGATGTTEYRLDPSKGSITINTSALPDGAYFTLATKIVGPGCVNNGVSMWLRSDYAADQNNWNDFSGNQVNAGATTTAPVFKPVGTNFNPALTFNGTTQYMTIPNASILGKFPFGSSARTVIGVGVASKDPAAYGMMMSYGIGGTGTGTYLGKDGNNVSAVGFGGYNNLTYNLPGSAGKLLSNTPTIIGGRYTGSAVRIDVNGLQDVPTLTAPWNTNNTGTAYIGVGVAAASHFWDGSISEVIVYNRELNSTELLKVNSYLGLKYGITINNGTTDYIASDGATKMWTVANNTGYNYRITGLGRDECTQLYQKQSISATGGIVTLALGDQVAASNAENTAEQDNDNAYFFIADNNGVTTYSTAFTGPGNLTSRMGRAWKVDKTNWADVNVSFKLNAGNDKVYLVVSADDVFDASDVAYKLDASGMATLSSADLPTGSYFTFAKELRGPGYVNTGVNLWLRADDGASSPDTWIDYSGNDNNATQTNASAQPTVDAANTNYNPGFGLYNGNQFMSLDVNKLPIGTKARTLIGVATPKDVTGTRYILGYGSGTGSAFSGLANVATTGTLVGWSNDIGSLPASFTATVNIPQELFGTWDGAGGTASLYSKMKSIATPVAKIWNTGTTGGAFIGSQIGAQYWNGAINEVIVYDRVLTMSERQRVSSYLALKYGYTIDQAIAMDYLATDGTVYWNATANSAYKNNITGIGRDDKTGLYQKQSRSVNTGANANMIAMGLGGIEASNADNTETITDDLSFLVWGDDGAIGTKTNEYPASLDPGGCSKITRLQREWKIQKTGDPGSVQLNVYLSGLVAGSATINDLRLLINNSSDFTQASTVVIMPSSYDAVTQIATFENLDFTDGQYFTLVTDITSQAPGGVISNLFTWHRADKGINNVSGTNVTSWIDQSASGKDQAGAAGTYPVYNSTANLINFNPVLSFDGTNKLLSNTTLTYKATTGEDIFAVVLPNAVAAQHDVVGLGTVANTGAVTELRYDANRLQYVVNDGTGVTLTSPSASNGIVQLANANRSAAGAAGLLMNGTSVVTGTITQAPSITQMNIGARRSAAANNLFFNGRIAEVALYTRQLTASEREKVASYFAIKYGITLPHNYTDPGGNIVWNAAANSAYGNNITGIGRDDCNGLHQKQSKSVNATEALVTLANGMGIFATNMDNTNTMGNNAALIIGDDNGNRTLWTMTNAPVNRQRIARTWKVQETNAVTSVTVQIPANSSAAAVKLPLERDDIAYLLVSNSTDFTTGVTEIAMTKNGANWEAAFDFNDGQYFTFATDDDCVSSKALLTAYNAQTTAASDKCYVNGWVLFRDPADANRYIAGIYDPQALIDRTKISAKINVNSTLADLGKGNSASASRLMRRMLEINCADCFDKTANPTPGFQVRMFYTNAEKDGSESTETNNMVAIKSANGLTDQHNFTWFKAADKTVADVLAKLSATGIASGGQEWPLGSLVTGQIDGIEYVDFDGVNSFSTFGGIWTVNIPKVLPVTWGDVKATPNTNNTITVKWSTSAEINNKYFVVERSEGDGRFIQVATVAGAGYATGMSNYSIVDNTAKPNVLYYYRIRQVDADGRSNYSRIVTATVRSTGEYLQVRPNPVTTQVLQWEMTVQKAQHLKVTITDAMGKTLGVREEKAAAGTNKYRMDMSGYSSGIYLIKVTSEDGTVYTEKFILSR